MGGCGYFTKPIAHMGPCSDAEAIDCATVTPDVGELEDTVGICSQQPSCNVCVQSEDQFGNPLWWYVTLDERCGCGDPEVIIVPDAGFDGG
jgi:hypothetical protein